MNPVAADAQTTQASKTGTTVWSGDRPPGRRHLPIAAKISSSGARSRDIRPYLPILAHIPGSRRVSAPICRYGLISPDRGRYRRLSRDLAPYLPILGDIPRSRGAICSYLAIWAHLGGYEEISPAIPGSCAVSPDLARYPEILRRICSYLAI